MGYFDKGFYGGAGDSGTSLILQPEVLNADPVSPTNGQMWLFVDAQAPTVPNGLIANVISSIRIDLSWTASTDNVVVTGYKIYRSTDNITFTNIGSSATISFQDTSCTPSTIYYYKISAYDAMSNESAQTTSVSATTLANQPPSGHAISVTGTSTTGFTVNLTTPATDIESEAITYDIKLDSVAITGQTDLTSSQFPRAIAQTVSAGSHTVTVTAKDTNGSTDVNYSFTAGTVIFSDYFDALDAVKWPTSYDGAGAVALNTMASITSGIIKLGKTSPTGTIQLSSTHYDKPAGKIISTFTMKSDTPTTASGCFVDFYTSSDVYVGIDPGIYFKDGNLSYKANAYVLPLITGFDTNKYYTCDLIYDFTNSTVTAKVDGVTKMDAIAMVTAFPSTTVANISKLRSSIMTTGSDKYCYVDSFVVVNTP